ncbi:MAG: hypothetical protein ACREKH_02925 [Candidatus Rokuibacteriota bacterium]
MALHLSDEFKAAIRAAAKARGVAVVTLACEVAGFENIYKYFGEPRAGRPRPPAGASEEELERMRDRLNIGGKGCAGAAGKVFATKGPRRIGRSRRSPIQARFLMIAKAIGFKGRVFVEG